MAKVRTKKTAAQVDALFSDGGEESLEQRLLDVKVEKAAEKLAEEFPTPPREAPDPRASERAWESYPIAPLGECPTCLGVLRERGDGLLVCKRDHVHDLQQAQVRADMTTISREAIREAGREWNDTQLTPPRAKVVFHEHETATLEHWEFDALTEAMPGRSFDNAFVKVSASLRPSERDGFDSRALKDRLRAQGARAVVLAVHSSAETPDLEAKREAANAIRPEDAITSWFDGLPISVEDRDAAKTKALALLAAEGG